MNAVRLLLPMIALALAVDAGAATPSAHGKGTKEVRVAYVGNDANGECPQAAFDELGRVLGRTVRLQTHDVTSYEGGFWRANVTNEFADVVAFRPDFVCFAVGVGTSSHMAKHRHDFCVKMIETLKMLKGTGATVVVRGFDRKATEPQWLMLEDATAIAGVDFLKANGLDAAGESRVLADILKARALPRIVPIAPKLSEIDPKTGEIEFYYPGRIWNGEANTAVLAGLDGVLRAEGRLDGKGHVTLRLGEVAPGPHTIYVRLQDVRTKRALVENCYPMRAKKVERLASGKRLNNFVTELYEGPAADGETVFVNPRDGFVFLGFEDSGRRVEARIDGASASVVRDRRGEPMQTMRWLSAGPHTVRVSGAAGGRMSVRAVKPLRIRSATSAAGKSDFNGYAYGADFQHLFILPWYNLVTVAGVEDQYRLGEEATGFADLTERGYRLFGSINMNPHGLCRRTVEDAAKVITGHASWRLGFDGAIDENRVDMEYLHHHTLAEACWRLANPAQAVHMFWAGAAGRFASPEVEASELSAIVNSGEGRGMNIFETYLRSYRDPARHVEQADRIVACMRSLVDMVPAARESVICYFGTYFYPGAYTDLCSPYADHRVVLDYWARRLATDPAVADAMMGLGSGSFHWIDEEYPRWIAALVKHYAIEGRTDSLAERFGYGYLPGFVKNADFEKGLQDWQAESAADGSLAPLHVAGFGKGTQGRQKAADGEGDDFALMTRCTDRPNRLSQTLEGLEPGRYYTLLFYTSDYDEYLKLAEKPARKGVARFRADIRGGEKVPALCLDSVGPKYSHAPAKLIIHRHRLVFRATTPTVTVTFLDRAEGEGDAVTDEVGLRQMVNFVSVKKYFLGEQTIDELTALAENRWEPRARH